MKSLSFLFLAILPLAAQLTPDQREADLTSLANYYAKYYAPANWKIQALGVNPLDLRTGDYIRRARQAPNDLAYFEVVREYVHSFKDGHTQVSFPSTFAADLGIRVDFYDDKPVLEQINRAVYPAARYPQLVLGSEIVSIDGVPASQLIDEFAKLNLLGSNRGSRRYGAILLGVRPQSILPFAPDGPDESDVVFKSAEGELATVRLKWTKSGTPVRTLGRPGTPTLKSARAAGASPENDFFAKIERDQAPDFLKLPGWGGEQGGEIVGYGARTPYYSVANFTQRRGRLSTDFTYSGTYTSEGLRIGLIRIPNFSPTDTTSAILELRSEVAFMRANTDGLVIDCSRNNGGSPALGAELMSMLTTKPYYIPPRQYLPGVRDLNSLTSLLEALDTLLGRSWVYSKWEQVVDQYQRSLASGPRALTGPVSAIIPASENQLFRGPLLDDNPPLSNATGPIGYDKPVIVLMDDFSVSHGEIFPATFQDNKRGPVVGYRSGGLGASVGCNTNTMMFSEIQICNSFSLVMRRNPVTTPEFPTAPYVENIGVIPDVELDYQTRENLLNGGRPFFEAFTKAMVNEIRRTQ